MLVVDVDFDVVPPVEVPVAAVPVVALGDITSVVSEVEAAVGDEVSVEVPVSAPVLELLPATDK